MTKKPVKERSKETEHLKQQLAELTETLKRVQAEFENYKKRVDRDKEQFVAYAKQELIHNLLPILDTFEVALKNKQSKEAFEQGIEMVYAELLSVLEKEGVTPIPTEGLFDPHLHEALLTENSEKQAGTILQELQKGYRLKDKVLRTAKVKIAKKEET